MSHPNICDTSSHVARCDRSLNMWQFYTDTSLLSNSRNLLVDIVHWTGTSWICNDARWECFAMQSDKLTSNDLACIANSPTFIQIWCWEHEAGASRLSCENIKEGESPLWRSEGGKRGNKIEGETMTVCAKARAESCDAHLAPATHHTCKMPQKFFCAIYLVGESFAENYIRYLLQRKLKV